MHFCIALIFEYLDGLIDLNSKQTCLGQFYAKCLGNGVRNTFILQFFGTCLNIRLFRVYISIYGYMCLIFWCMCLNLGGVVYVFQYRAFCAYVSIEGFLSMCLHIELLGHLSYFMAFLHTFQLNIDIYIFFFLFCLTHTCDSNR